MEKRSKKIIFVYDAVFPFVKGGAQKRFYEIGRRLAGEGCDVHIYGMKAWEGPDVIMQENITLHGIMKKRPLYTKSGRRSISEAIRFGFASIKIAKEDFDAMDCCGFPYFSLFPLRIITWLRRKPLYCTWHEVWGKEYWKEYLGKMGPVGYLTEKIAAALPDTIISVSEETTRELERKLGRRKGVITIPNGIDLKKIRKSQRAEEEYDILFAGRLLPYKNIDILLKAVALVKKERPEVTALIIGEGPEKEKLKQLAEKLDLQKNVSFLDFAEEEKVFSYMKSAKIFVLPSSREGFGIVALEANACGLPVLTVDCPRNAARHLVRKNGNGLVTEPDAKGIAKGIIELLKARPLLNSENEESIDFDWQNISRKVAKIFILNINK